jgi:hypothetical protein
MKSSRQCAICGGSGGSGMMVMGQYICPECQALLDDPKKRVFGCSGNRRFARGRPGKHMDLAKARH